MSQKSDLLQQSSHFAFGKNWASYAELISEPQISEATEGLKKLVGESLQGARVLDIGCGSGLHALCALRLGATEVVAMDIDPDSVRTTQGVLSARVPGQPWRVIEKSVFDTNATEMGQFDLVYSWGVLHHTGDMYRAIDCAAALVKPGGRFVFALYRKTRMCWFWRIEKKWYAAASERAQRAARAIYIRLFRIVMCRQGDPERSFERFTIKYKEKNRGMDFFHDVHDWMGGWPYESITPAQVEATMRRLGFKLQYSNARTQISSGIFGSGCDEFVYTRELKA